MLQVFSAVPTAHAQEIFETDAIRAILGEAENQGPKGMHAVATGIRNRGTLKGVYGHLAVIENSGHYARLTPKGPRMISKKIVDQARHAWRISKDHRLHTGTHWENIGAFGEPTWVQASGMEPVYTYRDHVFFKSQTMSNMSKGV